MKENKITPLSKRFVDALPLNTSEGFIHIPPVIRDILLTYRHIKTIKQNHFHLPLPFGTSQ